MAAAPPTFPASLVARARNVALRPRRSTVVLVALLRLLGLLVATELSGAAHALLDATAMLSGREHPDDDCDDEAGHECPPGCPNCHCTHAGLSMSSAARIEVSLTVLSPVRTSPGLVPIDELPPASTDLSQLYRPPRAHPLS